MLCKHFTETCIHAQANSSRSSVLSLRTSSVKSTRKKSITSRFSKTSKGNDASNILKHVDKVGSDGDNVSIIHNISSNSSNTKVNARHVSNDNIHSTDNNNTCSKSDVYDTVTSGILVGDDDGNYEYNSENEDEDNQADTRTATEKCLDDEYEFV